MAESVEIRTEWYSRQLNLENLTKMKVGDIIIFDESPEDHEPIRAIDIQRKIVKTLHPGKPGQVEIIHIYKASAEGKFFYHGSEYINKEEEDYK